VADCVLWGGAARALPPAPPHLPSPPSRLAVRFGLGLGPTSILCCIPPRPQVVRLEPQQYLDWIAAPSTGHPIMFAQPLLERLTCTQWCACLRSCVSSCAAAPASMLSLQKEFRFPGNSSPVCCP
jgi:hypothetical protein